MQLQGVYSLVNCPSPMFLSRLDSDHHPLVRLHGTGLPTVDPDHLALVQLYFNLRPGLTDLQGILNKQD